MDYSHLDCFCNNLGGKPNVDRFSINHTISHLSGIANKVKREVNIELNNVNCDKNYLLNYHLSEVENSNFDENISIVSINEMLIKYGVTFEDILNDNIEDSNFTEVLNTEYPKISDLNPYYNSAQIIQLELYHYVVFYFKTDMIKFFEDKKVSFNLDLNDLGNKLKWIGKPSQLGIIIRELVEMGYIEAPRRKTDDINYTQFAKDVISTFDIETTTDTLIKYLNLDTDKSQSLTRKFKENSFNIPQINIVS